MKKVCLFLALVVLIGFIAFWKPIKGGVRMVRGIFHIAREQVSKEQKGLIQFKQDEMVEYYPGGHLKQRRITKGPGRGTLTSWYEDGHKQEEVIFDKGQVLITRT